MSGTHPQRPSPHLNDKFHVRRFHVLCTQNCRRESFRTFSLFAILLLFMTGCHVWGTSRPKLDYRTVEESPLRDSSAAKAKHLNALKALRQGHLQRADQWVQESLLADVSFGPSHNTLGKLLYDQQKYYLAAWEFEYAIKAMPERPEPHNNLGLVYEAVGRFEEAISAYQCAADLDPMNPQFLGNLLRAKVRSGEKPANLQWEFNKLFNIETRPEWRDWCQRQLFLTNGRNHERSRAAITDKLPVPEQLDSGD